MTAARLPLPVGLRLEAILSQGITREELILSLKKNQYNELVFRGGNETDLSYFFHYAESQPEECLSAVRDGYSFKFLTIRGLKNFLILKYGLRNGTDLEFHQTYIDRVRLKKKWLPEISSMITSLWTFTILQEDEEQESVLVRFESSTALQTAGS
ncbi:hypothetical protein [Peribacillus kribbensis]|uniref:hypothetical protein n=1 Tax=Peribacillus kribbensis TaxID=356658 RepID=UPI00040B682A|nr:hypothetical protein [Peribacillus kribbensis]